MSYDDHDNDDEKLPTAIPLDRLKEMAIAVAEELESGDVTPALRERFINVRAALFQRGIFDPVLVRFDSATAPRASKDEIAEQLAAVAQSLA
ncbi:MAG TPA: hypothetical protein VGQ36_14000 [Thermoanaerobaculia bacterium]|jgi:hypothetical protein|nr:hypothetical protein [Thermoanaerobaculia bacterium]